ncbi:MAG: LamG-like jellyroll fold domain-containing protein [Candidatus Helarchaeota archaeon]
MSVLNVNAVYQETLLTWEFEAGHGNIALDSSGSNYYGIMTGADFEGNTKKFGNYAIKFDGNNDYINSITQATLPDIMTLNFWVYKESNSGERVIYLIENTNKEHFKLNYNENSDEFTFYYYTDSNTTENIIISHSMSLNSWHMITSEVNYITNSYKLMVDKNILYSSVIPETFVSQDTNNFLKLGVDILGSDDFKGKMDAFNIFDFSLNISQINDLYATNHITLIQEVEEPQINDTTIVDIISSYTPSQNSTIGMNQDIEVNLNLKASCQLYLNNELVLSLDDTLSFAYPLLGNEAGDYEYMVYCDFIEDGILKFELTDIINFEIVVPPTTATFQIEGIDFDPSKESLYLVTPCPEEGFSAIGYATGYQSKYNPEGVEWLKFENNYVTINTSAETHEFCIFNGRVIVNEEGKTTNYNVQEKYGMLEVGKIDIPNQVNNFFKLRVEKLEVFDFTQPKAYAETVGAFLSAFIMFLLGGLIMFAGMKTGSKMAVLIGGVLLLGAFGLTLGGVVTLVTL